MTVVLTDGMENATNWPGGAPTFVAGRTANCMRVTGSALGPEYTLPGAYVGPLRTRADFWYRISAIGSLDRHVILFRQGTSNNLLTFGFDLNGAIFVKSGGTTGSKLATSAATGLITAATWTHLEIEVVVADAGGLAKATVNGTARLNFTGDTQPSGVPTDRVERIALGAAGSSTSGDYDDMVIESFAAGVAMKVWTGSAWVDAPVKVWNGSAWADASAVKTWSGSAWV